MNEDLAKQLKTTQHAVDLIKISQQAPHTSVKEAMTKMLKCISMAVKDMEYKLDEDKVYITNDEQRDLLEEAQKIADSRKEEQDESRRNS